MNNILVCGILKGIHLSLTNFHYKPTEENLGKKSEKQKINFKSIEILDPKIFEQFDMEEYNQAKMKQDLRRNSDTSVSIVKNYLAQVPAVIDHSQKFGRSNVSSFKLAH